VATEKLCTAADSPALTVQNHGYPPEWKRRVPLSVRVQRTVSSDLPYVEAQAAKGVTYPVWVNSNGAVSAILPNGEALGLKPQEFNVVDWHRDYPLDVYNLACRDLPEGYYIEVNLEQGSGGVTLTDPEGEDIYVCPDDLDIDQQIREALRLALEHHRGSVDGRQ